MLPLMAIVLEQLPSRKSNTSCEKGGKVKKAENERESALRGLASTC
jgi:hypothetical protein